MSINEDKVSLNTKVIAILRKAPKAGEHPLSCQVVEERDLGPNLVTAVGRHLMAAWCANSALVTPTSSIANHQWWSGQGARLPAANIYSKANGWFVGGMSVGTNNDGSNSLAGTSAASTDLELNNEYTETLIPLQADIYADQNNVDPFHPLLSHAHATYTQIAWRGFYNASQAIVGGNGITEVGLWVPHGATSPAGNSIHTTHTLGFISKDTTQSGYGERGPLVARKVLSSGIEKTGDFTLEFRWVWIF